MAGKDDVTVTRRRVPARRRQHAARQRPRRPPTSGATSTARSAPSASERYWAIFEELRGELGYADYLGALQRYRVEHPRDPHLLAVSSFLINYPFANRLFPGSLDVIEHLARLGTDGDPLRRRRGVPAAQGRALRPVRGGRAAAC